MKNKNRINPATFINSKITATISIALVLFILGLIVLLSLFAKNLSTYVKENLTLTIVLDENMKETDIKSLQRKLDSAPYVKSSEYISKEQAAKDLEKELGENPEIFLGYNPLSASIEVKLRSEYANNDSVAKIENSFKKMSNVQDMLYRKDLIQSVNENLRKIGLILFSLAIVLLFISFALINNTIRLMVYSKRFIIHTMKLVGATNSFIRKPFIRSNILSGIIAAILAICMLCCLLYYISQGSADFIQLVDINSLLIVFATVIIMGIVISITATYFAVNKYLRMKGGDLYYV